MILHPTVIANLLAAYAASFMLIYAAYYGLQILSIGTLKVVQNCN